MVESILDKHEFQDGRIVVYRRGDIGDNSNFSVRLRIPKTTGYVIRSSGTSDLFQARKFAEELFDELRLKVLNGESLRDRPFDSCVKEYERHLKTRSFKTEKERKEVIAYFANYPTRHFQTKPIAKIGEQELTKFVDWRIENPIRRANVRINTVRAELNTLKRLFIWAKSQGYISNVPEPKKPKAEKNRRPHFDSKDWNKLVQYLREFAAHKNSSVRRDREMLRSYILILSNTGIRIGEARRLKWRDISQVPSNGLHGEANIILVVNGKTGIREVVARTPKVKEYFRRILDLRKAELKQLPRTDSHVFCHRGGKPIQSFKKSFDSLIKKAGVEKDTFGQRRTIYSLRHTYATFRLQEGVHHFLLARNMGTSVAMLEDFYGHTSNVDAADELTKSKPRLKLEQEREHGPLDWLRS